MPVPIYLYTQWGWHISDLITDKSCRKYRNKHFVVSNFISENPAVYEIMWKHFIELARSQMKIWRMRIACWIPKATH